LFRSFSGSFGAYLNRNMDIRFIVDLLTAAILYAATHFIISRKLNLA